MDDQYFGSIPPRVKAFMEDLNTKLWKLGITAKTQHCEVACIAFNNGVFVSRDSPVYEQKAVGIQRVSSLI